MMNGLNMNQYGSKRWYLNNKLHRINGPAIIVYTGIAVRLWYYNDFYIKCNNQKDFERLIKLMVFI